MSTLKAGAITFVAIAAFWCAATRSIDTLDAAPMTHLSPLAPDIQMQPPLRIVHHEAAEAGTGRRNLFSYVIPGPPLVIVAERPVTPLPPSLPMTVEAAPVPEPPPHFGYRFIGRFGHDHSPLAAFVADGEIVTVHRGDRIGRGFTLQSIGVESADVVDERGRVVRVHLGE